MENGSPTLHRVRVQEQEARSVVGSGDAFLAGYVAARYAGQEPVECLRFGVACGAESTQHFGAGIIDAARVDRLLNEVEAERLRSAPRSAEPVRKRPAPAAAAIVPLLAAMAAARSSPDTVRRRSRILRWK